MTAALRLTDVVVAYRDRLALDGVSVTVDHGERVGVIGPNGAGKSSLAKAVVGLVRPRRGSIEIEGGTGRRARGRVAYLPQRHQVDLEHPAQVRDVVGMGRYPIRGPVGPLRADDRARIGAALERVGLADLARTRIGELSGGQQQRVFLARAFAQEASVLLLDEPYAGLDAVTCDVIDRELERAARDGAAVLVVNHDLVGLAQRYDRLLVLHRHVVADGAPAEVLTGPVLTAAYGPGIFLGVDPGGGS
jgi:ABC-type Mn2+/Zn2+ transport system ATPase subunit